ncbi:MAG: hypothetical protein JNN32_04230 [Flavobacteriales bacterium]|nr:hypothetical protein [Flavobacteriales bacterium]
MKWLFLLCMLSALCSTAQPPLPFPTGDVQWTVNSVQMGESYPDRIYATMGDSTFNGLLYQKIGWVDNTGLPWETEDLTYSGIIRDESGRWLFVPSWSAEEYPLFDFTGDVGDTVSIQNPLFAFDPADYTVESITTTQTVVDERRVWTLIPAVGFGYPEYFIEGIGSTYGLFGHSTFISDAGSQLICMEENGELIYRIPEAESCYYLSTGLEERAAEGALHLAPNPSREQVILSVDGADITQAGLVVNDAMGRVVELTGLQRTMNTLWFDVSALPVGLYTVSITPRDRAPRHVRLMVER